MRRALSVATVTALSLLFCLFVGYAQEEGATAVPGPLEQELTAMEAAFAGLQSFMGELIGEVKGNMADIDSFNAKVDDYRDIVEAVSVEIKDAEGKIIGLRTDVNALGKTQQELMVRVVALESGLSELASFCDELKARLDVATSDLGTLRSDFDALAEDYGAFKEDYDAFQTKVYGDINALRDAIYADLRHLEETCTAGQTLVESRVEELSARVLALEEEDVGTFKKKVLELERSMAALAIRVDNNRAKLEGFDHAIAALADEMTTTREGILQSNQELLSEFDARLTALEDGTGGVKSQIDTIMFISIVALLAGVGALIWGFLGNG